MRITEWVIATYGIVPGKPQDAANVFREMELRGYQPNEVMPASSFLLGSVCSHWAYQCKFACISLEEKCA